MSRIGKLPISIPAGVTISQKENVVTVKGSKGELSQYVHPSIKVIIENNQITFEIDEKHIEGYKQKQAYHGLYRSLVNNMVIGVSEGYSKTLELVGVGYRVSNQGNLVEFTLGYTHPIFLQLPKEVKVETKSERNQNPIITIETADKQLLGLICAVAHTEINKNKIPIIGFNFFYTINNISTIIIFYNIIKIKHIINFLIYYLINYIKLVIMY